MQLLSKSSIAIIASVLTLLFLEIVLRLFGYSPGLYRKYKGFQKVDTLIVYKNYTMTEDGFFRLNPVLSKDVFADLKGKILGNDFKEMPEVEELAYTYPEFLLSDGYMKIVRSSLLLQHEEYYQNIEGAGNGINELISKSELIYQGEFGEFYIKEIKKGDAPLDEVKTEIGHYVSNPFNEDGFRSISFKRYNHSGPRILLIGDSFTWGESAEPIYESFYDKLLAKGFLVYNAGISGAGPDHYEAIARKYIPLLEPDIVVVNFYMGNDMICSHKDSERDRLPMHLTNAGWLNAVPEQKYLNPSQAYDYYLRLISIPDQKQCFFNSICARSAIGGLIWHTLYKIGCVKHPEFRSYENSHVDHDIVSKKHIYSIKQMCKENSCKLLVSLIPDPHKHTEQIYVDSSVVEALLPEVDFIAPVSLTKSDYALPDDFHFNNEGMTKYTRFLENHLNKIIKTNDTASN